MPAPSGLPTKSHRNRRISHEKEVGFDTAGIEYYEIAKLFMEKGFHIACDKPLTLTVAQAEELAALAKQKDRLFAVTYTYSAYPMIRQARELIDHGEIGDIVYINAEYPDNVTGLIWASQVAIGHECDLRLRVFGTKGSIEWQHQDAGHLKVSHLNHPVQIYSAACPYNYVESIRLSRTSPGHPEGLFEAFANIYRSFCEVLLARKEGRAPESFTSAKHKRHLFQRC